MKTGLGLRTDADLARHLGIRSSTLANWRSRESLNYDTVFANREDLDLHWLLTGEGEMRRGATLAAVVAPVVADDVDDEGALPRLRIPIYMNGLSAGTGRGIEPSSELVEYGEVIEAWLRHELRIDPRLAFVARVWGDSMSPLINEADFVIGVREETLYAEGIYAVVYNGDLLVKHVQQEGARVMLISENSRYRRREVDPSQDGFYVLGRVLRRVTRFY